MGISNITSHRRQHYPTPFLTSFLSFVLPSIRRDIFCGENMNLKYS
nr:MAG TPA: hypothetical protein [Caudoviricetes sp.]